ncbi:MAG TPA: hypothetical protein VF452_14385, partial [Candidatus Binatia bacterium]
SHLGSKIHAPAPGNSPTRLASIGKTGGFTGRFIGYCARAPYPEVNGGGIAFRAKGLLKYAIVT